MTHQQTFKQKPPGAVGPRPMFALTGVDREFEEKIRQMAGGWRSGAPADNASGFGSRIPRRSPSTPAGSDQVQTYRTVQMNSHMEATLLY